MPYKKEYNRKTVGSAGSKTPESVMGGQGKAAPLKLDHFRNKPTGQHPFPPASGQKASGRHNPPNHYQKEG